MLANLLLDDLDKELERRGHRFCRYADDCNIYVRSKQAGERVMQSITRFLVNKLLRVNAAKSAAAHVQESKCLGYRLLREGALGIAPASLKRVKERIRQITRRNRGVSMETVIYKLKGYLTGWVPLAKPYRFRSSKCATLPETEKALDSTDLFLLVTPKGGKWWRFKYQFEGRGKTISLGVFPTVLLPMRVHCVTTLAIC